MVRLTDSQTKIINMARPGGTAVYMPRRTGKTILAEFLAVEKLTLGYTISFIGPNLLLSDESVHRITQIYYKIVGTNLTRGRIRGKLLEGGNIFNIVDTYDPRADAKPESTIVFCEKREHVNYYTKKGFLGLIADHWAILPKELQDLNE